MKTIAIVAMFCSVGCLASIDVYEPNGVDGGAGSSCTNENPPLPPPEPTAESPLQDASID